MPNVHNANSRTHQKELKFNCCELDVRCCAVTCVTTCKQDTMTVKYNFLLFIFTQYIEYKHRLQCTIISRFRNQNTCTTSIKRRVSVKCRVSNNRPALLPAQSCQITIQGGPKSKPAYFCNNFVYCQPIFLILLFMPILSVLCIV